MSCIIKLKSTKKTPLKIHMYIYTPNTGLTCTQLTYVLPEAMNSGPPTNKFKKILLNDIIFIVSHG